MLLNADVLERDFKSSAGEADASLLSGTIIAGIQVDLFRMLTGALKEQLAEVGEWEECGDGAVGPSFARSSPPKFRLARNGVSHV